MLSRLDGYLRSTAAASLGPVEDVGFIFEGKALDNVRYESYLDRMMRRTRL